MTLHRRTVLTVAPIGELTIEAHGSLEAVEPHWRAFESHAQGHPYQAFEWQSAWHATLRAPRMEPFVVVVRKQAAVVMLLPLALERHLGMLRLVPMGAPVCDYQAPLVDAQFAPCLTAGAAQQVLAAIAELAQCDYVLMTHVPPMAGAVRNPFSAVCERAFSAGAHATALGPEWMAFYAQRRSAKTRSRFRGKEKAMAEHGEIAFTEVTQPDERAELAMEMMALKAAGLKASAGPFNTFARPAVQAFFRQVARDAPAQDVALFKLTVGGALVAAVLGLVRNGCFYYQVPVYPDHPLRRFSPGQLLVARLMEWAIARGCTRFDFTIGDESYKDEWCDETWVLGCGAWPRTARGRIGAAIALAGIAATRRVKARPAVYAAAVALRTAMGRLRHVLGLAPA